MRNIERVRSGKYNSYVKKLSNHFKVSYDSSIANGSKLVTDSGTGRHSHDRPYRCTARTYVTKQVTDQQSALLINQHLPRCARIPRRKLDADTVPAKYLTAATKIEIKELTKCLLNRSVLY